MSTWSAAARFASNFFRHPKMLGALVPSSKILVNDVLSQVEWDRAKVVVEYGPGVGTLTQEMLNRMRPDAVLVALEVNPSFLEFLGEEISDPRFRLVHESAKSVRQVLSGLGLPNADYIISGIPFSNLPDLLRHDIAQESRHALQPDGAFLVYQYTRTVLPYLESNFGSVQQNFQLRNIFPAHIFYCTL